MKCSHEPCTCTVDVGEHYCCRVCKEDVNLRGAMVEGVPSACRCPHSECEAR